MRRSTVTLLLGLACCGAQYYVNDASGVRVDANGPSDNPDLAACRAEYQRAFASGPALWMGQIVPECMKARGWRQE